MAAAEGWTPRRDNPYAGPGYEGLDDAAGAAGYTIADQYGNTYNDYRQHGRKHTQRQPADDNRSRPGQRCAC